MAIDDYYFSITSESTSKQTSNDMEKFSADLKPHLRICQQL